MSMGWLKNYRWLKSHQNTEFPEKDYAKIAATEAELKAMKFLKKQKNVIEVYHATRLQHADGGISRREVDLIALLKDRIILIEIKNFSGDISMDKEGILHENGKTRRWSFEKLSDAATRLATSLMTVGIKLQNTEIHSLLYLAGNGEPDKSVTTGRRLSKTHIANSEKELKQKISTPLGVDGDLSKEKIQAIKTFFEMCGTWDEITYRNGVKLEGDLIDKQIPENWREKYQSIDINNMRGAFATIFFGPRFTITIEDWNHQISESELDIESQITIKPPGENRESISSYITDLATIKFGYSKLFDWTEVKLIEETYSMESENNSEKQQAQREYKKGDIIENATISNVHEEFGVFIKLDAKQDGLYHKNEMSMVEWTQRHELYHRGMQVNVEIINIKKTKKKTNIGVKIIN